jgi:hypothetical protein
VKNDGRNMPTACHWMTKAASSKWKPHPIMASGVADIRKVMLP